MTPPMLRIVAFAAIFFAVSSLTVGITPFKGGLALVWFGAAIAAAMLIDLPRAYWTRGLLAIMAVSAIVTSVFGLGPRVAAPLALINAAEAWLIASLLLALRPQRDWLDSIPGLASLVAAGAVACGITALAGGATASMAVGGIWYHHSVAWWAAHGLGTLIGFPLAYLVGSAAHRQLPAWPKGRRGLELAAYLVVIVLTARLSLGRPLPLPLLFLPILPLLLASFRCGREGAIFGMLAVAGVSVWSFYQPDGVILSLAISQSQKILFLQFYIATLTLLALPVSVTLRQHQLLVAELEERKAMEQLVAEHSDDALVNLDEHGLVRYASPAGARLTGESDLTGASFGIFFDPLDEPLVVAALERAAAAPERTEVLERPVLCGDEQLWLQAKIRAVSPEGRSGTLQGFAVTIRDVTARKRTELDAIEAAETDALTGLPNRRALMDELERALAHADQRPFALAILDLDHFKAINDTHGHIVGDAVLREVAGVMRRLSGPTSYFARLGGEEFALIARLGSFAEAEQLCERLRRETAQLLFTAPDGTRFSPTASIGLARVALVATPAQALQAADMLLYAAKNSGRNRVRIAPLPKLAGTPGRRAA